MAVLSAYQKAAVIMQENRARRSIICELWVHDVNVDVAIAGRLETKCFGLVAIKSIERECVHIGR